jgi:hypothetical protein
MLQHHDVLLINVGRSEYYLCERPLQCYNSEILTKLAVKCVSAELRPSVSEISYNPIITIDVDVDRDDGNG